jgi:chemotaxis signal transduction protein
MIAPHALHAPIQLLVFAVGEEKYAVPVEDVEEIARHAEVRDRDIPVVDLTGWLELAPEAPEDWEVVVVATAAGVAGLVVDQVQGVVFVDPGQLDEPPVDQPDAVEWIVRDGERRIVLLSPERVLAGDAFEA